MKKSEFIGKVGQLGFKVAEGSSYTGILTHNDYLVATVNNKRTLRLSTDYGKFARLSIGTKHELFKLITEYSGTVIPDREDHESWVVKYPTDDRAGYHYFSGWCIDNPLKPDGIPNKNNDKVIKFDDKDKADKLASLIDGEVEKLR